MNIFYLASLQLKKEGKDYKDMGLILKYAIKIRKWLDKHGNKTAARILQGEKVYQYGNQIKTYCRA